MSWKVSEAGSGFYSISFIDGIKTLFAVGLADSFSVRPVVGFTCLHRFSWSLLAVVGYLDSIT